MTNKHKIFERIMESYSQYKRFNTDDHLNQVKKFNTPLEELAIESTSANKGDFISFEIDDSDKQWFEIVDKEYPDEEGDVRITLIPVGPFGEKLTKPQIRKINPTWADKMEKYGYAKKEYITAAHDVPILRVISEPLYNADYSKVTGVYPRKIDDEFFPEYDENGYAQVTDEYLKDHPDFDPDFDRLPSKEFLKGKYVPKRGSFEARKNYKSAVDEYDSKKKSISNKYKGKTLYSPWGGDYNGLTSAFWELQPELSEEDQKIFDRNFGSRGDMTPREFKKWCLDKGMDWQAIKAAKGETSSAFADAYRNANY